MKNNEQPIPLFDTLEQLASNKSVTPPSGILASDYQHACTFLYSYRGSVATFSAYRRELERFLQWTILIAKKSLTQIKRVDIEQFIEFCQKPPIHWIGTKNAPRFIDVDGQRIANPIWKPFVATITKMAHQQGETVDPKKYLLSQKALQAIFAILGSFYSYLIQEDYVAYNPVSQIRQKSKFIRKQQNNMIIRRLTELQWSYVIETAEQMANANPLTHERTLFIMNILYGMYLRISELVSSQRWEPQMGHFQMDREGNWWFKTVGKGNKERIITVSDSMLNALKRYRRSLELSPLPYPGETTYLISKARGQGPITSTRMIRLIVQQCFDAAIARLLQDGFSEEAEQLKAATVHWLRHTGISDDGGEPEGNAILPHHDAEVDCREQPHASVAEE